MALTVDERGITRWEGPKPEAWTITWSNQGAGHLTHTAHAGTEAEAEKIAADMRKSGAIDVRIREF